MEQAEGAQAPKRTNCLCKSMAGKIDGHIESRWPE